MTPAEKAKWLVNDCYYQPITIYLNVNNNSGTMWDYAKRCATIAVDELIVSTWSWDWYKRQKYIDVQDELKSDYWKQVKEEIEKL